MITIWKVYISIDGDCGYAIVEGGEAYEVEFEYHSGEISRLTCSCFCSCSCKHEFAAMLQLRETLEKIEKNYAAEYERTGYFPLCIRELCSLLLWMAMKRAALP